MPLSTNALHLLVLCITPPFRHVVPRRERDLPAQACCSLLELPRYACHAAGYGLTFVLMLNRIRFGLHKFAKEGLLCLLESCTAKEVDQVRV